MRILWPTIRPSASPRRNRRNGPSYSRTAETASTKANRSTAKETAEALDISQKTAGNIIGQLRKEGLLPAFDQHSPRKTRKNATTGKKKETMTTTSKLTADKITATKLTPSDITPVGTIIVGPQATADPRIIIANALVGIFDAVSALQRTAFQANDKVVYGFATKLLTGELMDIKANYSKDVAK